MSSDLVQLQPGTVHYKGHKIVLTHRTKTNDWIATVSHTRTITLTHRAPRYEAALKQAKQELDVLLGDKK